MKLCRYEIFKITGKCGLELDRSLMHCPHYLSSLFITFFSAFSLATL